MTLDYNLIDSLTANMQQYKEVTGFSPSEIRISPDTLKQWEKDESLLKAYSACSPFLDRKSTQNKTSLTLKEINFVFNREGLPKVVVVD